MARIMTTKAISQVLPPPDLGGGALSGSFGFAIKVSSVDEKYQSTTINAQSLNGFHARVGKRQKHGNPILRLPCDSVDSGDSITGFAKILDQAFPVGKKAGDVSPRSAARLPLLSCF
jgi:hypothetical protein